MYWRRWRCFISEWGVGDNPFLDNIPSDNERLLLARGFVVRHRLYKFDSEGRAAGERPKPVVSSTLRDAISSVASAFRKCGRPSPFHLQSRVNDSGSIHPRIRSLLRGFESIDDPPNRQKAVTPALLRDLVKMVTNFPEGSRHAADLIVGAYFFAMRACEFCSTKNRGRTRILTCGNVTFRDKDRNQVRQSEKGELPVCSYKQDGNNDKRFEVSDERIRDLLRSTCRIHDGINQYGIGEREVGTRSIRSGAAMALAVQGARTVGEKHHDAGEMEKPGVPRIHQAAGSRMGRGYVVQDGQHDIVPRRRRGRE